MAEAVTQRTPSSVSAVVPCYNEKENISLLYGRLSPVLSAVTQNYEIIFVNDGSRDRTLETVEFLASRDHRVKFVSFSRNFGHEAASTAGLDAATGEVVILIDADLQDPPEFIPSMLKKWSEGYDIVYAVRRTRDGEGLVKRATSHLFYLAINSLSAPPLPVDTGDFRLVDRRALEAFRECREVRRFVRGLSTWIGFRQIGVEYDRDRRHRGRTKYNYVKLSLLAMEAISSFSIAPLRLALILGGIGILSGVGMSVVVLVQKLFFGVNPRVYTLLVLSVFFMGSMNIFIMGILAEYIGKIFLETQKRPMYIVDKKSDGLKTRTYG